MLPRSALERKRAAQARAAFARRYDSMGLDIEENDVEKAPSDAMEDYLRSVRVEAGLES